MWDLGTIIAMNQEAQEAGDLARAKRRREFLEEMAQERMDDDGGPNYERHETIEFPADEVAAVAELL